LALCARCRVLFLTPGIVPSRRYSVIGFHQSTTRLRCPMIAAPSPSGPGLSVIGPIKAPGLAFNIGTGPFSPGMVLGMGVELPSSREAPGKHVGISSRQIEGLNKSSMNTPGGVVLGSIRAERGHRLPRCLIRGYDESQNCPISPPAFLPPVSKPPCGSHDSLILPLPN
jgi:hypothetical protein